MLRGAYAAALAVCLAAALAVGRPTADAAPLGETPSAKEIIDKAVARAKWEQEQGFQGIFGFQYRSVTRKFDRGGRVKSVSDLLYEVRPIGGEPYYGLVKISGRPLSQRELRKERERLRKFRKDLARRKSGAKTADDGASIRFNRELVSRFRADVAGRETVRGRSVYVLEFEPRAGSLPVRRRIDYALNKSKGRLWIDAEEFGVLGVEFELLEPVRIWAGILGRLSALRGRLELTRLDEGAYVPRHLEMSMSGRILFRSLDQRSVLDWTGYRRIAEDESAEQAEVSR